MSAALELRDAAVRRGERLALDGVSCAVAPGEVLAVIGPNGSGKSTLAMAAAGLLPLARGAARIGGDDAGRLSHRARAMRVAYVPQRSELIAPLAVRTVVAQGRYAHGDAGGLGGESPAARAAIDDALARVDAVALGARAFTELSGGEAQRVLLARALATGAPALVLDEPASALDVAHRLRLGRLVRELAAAGKAVLIALHDLAEARLIADRALLLDHGRPHAQGPARDVIAAGPVRAVYGVELVEGAGLGYREAGGG